jgi:hypothetical protein
MFRPKDIVDAVSRMVQLGVSGKQTQLISKERDFMQPINKHFLIILGLVLLASIVSYALAFDKLGNNPTRLKPVAAAEAVRDTSSEARLSTGERYDNTYPQAVDNSAKLWITPKRLLTQKAISRGIRSTELKCLHELIWRESRFDPQAANPNSSAFGLFQQLKLDPSTSIKDQIRLGFKYIKHRYGTPCAALTHHDIKGWY